MDPSTNPTPAPIPPGPPAPAPTPAPASARDFDIRAFRARHGYTQQQLADAYGYSSGRQWINKLETGRIKPTLRFIRWMQERDALAGATTKPAKDRATRGATTPQATPGTGA